MGIARVRETERPLDAVRAARAELELKRLRSEYRELREAVLEELTGQALLRPLLSRRSIALLDVLVAQGWMRRTEAGCYERIRATPAEPADLAERLAVAESSAKPPEVAEVPGAIHRQAQAEVRDEVRGSVAPPAGEVPTEAELESVDVAGSGFSTTDEAPKAEAELDDSTSSDGTRLLMADAARAQAALLELAAQVAADERGEGELATCPFCGEPGEYTDADRMLVRCSNDLLKDDGDCAADVCMSDEAWNRRASDGALGSLAETLKAAAEVCRVLGEVMVEGGEWRVGAVRAMAREAGLRTELEATDEKLARALEEGASWRRVAERLEVEKEEKAENRDRWEAAAHRAERNAFRLNADAIRGISQAKIATPERGYLLDESASLCGDIGRLAADRDEWRSKAERLNRDAMTALAGARCGTPERGYLVGVYASVAADIRRLAEDRDTQKQLRARYHEFYSRVLEAVEPLLRDEDNEPPIASDVKRVGDVVVEELGRLVGVRELGLEAIRYAQGQGYHQEGSPRCESLGRAAAAEGEPR